MSEFVGTWLVGSDNDDVQKLTLAVTDDFGVAWPIAVGTGWTVALEVHKAGEPAVFATVSGNWQNVGDTSNPNTEYEIGTASILFPATVGDEIAYDAYITLSKAGVVHRHGFDAAGTAFGFTIRRVAA